MRRSVPSIRPTKCKRENRGRSQDQSSLRPTESVQVLLRRVLGTSSFCQYVEDFSTYCQEQAMRRREGCSNAPRQHDQAPQAEAIGRSIRAKPHALGALSTLLDESPDPVHRGILRQISVERAVRRESRAIDGISQPPRSRRFAAV